jgi:hypothetical protein
LFQSLFKLVLFFNLFHRRNLFVNFSLRTFRLRSNILIELRIRRRIWAFRVFWSSCNSKSHVAVALLFSLLTWLAYKLTNTWKPVYLFYFACARQRALNYWLLGFEVGTITVYLGLLICLRFKSLPVLVSEVRFSRHDVSNFTFELFHSFLKVKVVHVVRCLMPFWFNMGLRVSCLVIGRLLGINRIFWF